MNSITYVLPTAKVEKVRMLVERLDVLLLH